MKKNKIVRIAVIVTCFNRCKKTLACLQSLIVSMNTYNKKSEIQVYVEIFLTDDGCTDNTVAEVQSKIAPIIPVKIIQGSGSLFWAGGMRSAWKESKKREWDYFLLLNDDTVLYESCLEELFQTETFCKMEYGLNGVYSGITTAPGDKNCVTYGGSVWDNRLLGRAHRLSISDKPQRCDVINANILLVPNSVVDLIGIFYEGYIHGGADYDYAVMANRNNIPVLITANSCGECEFDHTKDYDKPREISRMTLSERRKYFAHPLHSIRDHLTYTRRVHPFRYPFVLVGRFINLYFPYLYVFLYNIRTK